MGWNYIVVNLDTKKVVCEGMKPKVYGYVEDRPLQNLKIYMEVA